MEFAIVPSSSEKLPHSTSVLRRKNKKDFQAPLKGKNILIIAIFFIFLTPIWIYLERISLPFRSEQTRETCVDHELKCLTVKRLTITAIHLRKQTFPWEKSCGAFMRWLNVEMLNVKKVEMVNLCLISWGCNFKILRVIPKSFWSIVPGGKYHTKVNSSG